MEGRFVLSDYVEQALVEAAYDKLEDGTFAGRIPACPGVVAFGGTLRECEDELCSTREDWILVGLKLGHPLPILAGIDLNRQPLSVLRYGARDSRENRGDPAAEVRCDYPF
ncbi:MAG TPA: type II toxin-antitoxin system HicB family antitoxin [Thermoanaerobaculia bacterium]|nr:type II toxin-antitoxin system HicB family antitoxin [Thermoanaerobaculia bacterium]